MNQAVIEKLNIVLEDIERRVVKNVEEDAGSMSFLTRIHQEHQAVLYFRDILARRHTEPTQDTCRNDWLCRDEAILMVDRLIDYHARRLHNIPATIGHDSAVAKLIEIRDHLDRCYEIRSCD